MESKIIMTNVAVKVISLVDMADATVQSALQTWVNQNPSLIFLDHSVVAAPTASLGVDLTATSYTNATEAGLNTALNTAFSGALANVLIRSVTNTSSAAGFTCFITHSPGSSASRTAELNSVPGLLFLMYAKQI